MVTKRQALDDLIDRIINPERGFAVNDRGFCVYDRKANGGCAIGHFLLPDEDTGRLEGGRCSSERVRRAMARADFEDSESVFWADLQRAHDQWVKPTTRDLGYTALRLCAENC